MLPLLLTAVYGGNAKRPVIRMATEATFPPYEYREGTKIVGIDPDIINEIARRSGYDVIIEDMQFNSVIAAVQTGKVDVGASGITVTPERAKSVNFTMPYAQAGQLLLTHKTSPYRSVADIENHRVGVQMGSTGDIYVTKNIRCKIERYGNSSMVVEALKHKKVDVAVVDSEPAKVYLAKNPDLRKLEEPLVMEYYAFALSKKRTDLLDIFNRALVEMKADGTLEKIFEKHKSHVNSMAEADDGSSWKRFCNALKTNFVSGDRYMFLVKGFLVTLEVSAAAVLLGLILGFIVAVIRCTADQTGNLKTIDFLCKIYLTVIRGTPVVVQLLIIYFVIFGSMNVNKVFVAIVAFGLNSGAYVAEIIRSGIMSIDRGQLEAGRSLGLSYAKTMVLIILPQAFKNVLPALGNEFIVLLKETSVAGYIALEDLTKGGDIIRGQTYNAFMPLAAVALIYLAAVMLLSYLLTILEKRLKKNE